MSTFTLATGRKVEKNATYCVAVKTRGRWNHQFFKSYKGAINEMRRLRSHSADTIAYYDIQDFKLIEAN
jgi:hypothetical protein